MFGIVLNVNEQRKEMQIKCIVLYLVSVQKVLIRTLSNEDFDADDNGKEQ